MSEEKLRIDLQKAWSTTAPDHFKKTTRKTGSLVAKYE